MPGLSRTSDDLDPRRRRILYRAWHRGTREMDLVLGRFADAAIADLDDGELDDLERIMEVPDRDLFAWIIGQEPLPEIHDVNVLHKVRRFHAEFPLIES